ncbi:MAG: Rieske (2Fe-2S) protein [Blastocatellia bacterium]|nr:Rieske (2Fe-2S) protein [Blastocatellia bacterium]
MGKPRENKKKPQREGRVVTVGKAESVPPGRGATVKLSDGTEVAVFNIDGTFHAIENFCPHKGYPLADSRLRGPFVECDWHGWMFDVRSGVCFRDKRCSVESYRVETEDGWIKLHV